MKKLFLTLVAGSAAAASFAQLRTGGTPQLDGLPIGMNGYAVEQKTAADGDTIVGKRNFPIAYLDTLVAYRVDNASPNDSGFIYGTNPYGDLGAAERYDYNGADSAVRVIGVVSVWNGRVSSTSTRSLNMRVWPAAPKSLALGATRPKLFYSGLPGATPLATQSVLWRNLGINPTGPDTFKRVNFATPTAFLTDTFFVGYDMTYAWGSTGTDTIGVYTTFDGDRFSPSLTFTPTNDTLIQVRNAAKYDNSTWHDNFQENFALFHHMVLLPVLVVDYLSVNGVSKKDLTFFGNYPNPAVSYTNVRFSLKKATDVTLTVVDMTGRTVHTQQENGRGTGEHIVRLNTSALPAGQYTYLIRTAAGDGMAAPLTVVK